MAEGIAQRLGGLRAERKRRHFSDLLPITLRSAVHAPVSEGRFRQPWSQRIVLIKWILRGGATAMVRGRRTPFGPGQVFVHTPAQPHAIWVTQPDTELCWFSADGPLIIPFAHLAGLRPGVFEYPAPPPVAEIEELIAALADQSMNGFRHSSALAVALLYRIGGHLPPVEPPLIVHRVRHLIQEGVSNPELSVQQIAKRLVYNRAALSRVFHQQTGTTILQCITQARLHEAEFLLRRTDDRVSDVARKCGFADAPYFTQWFKKHTGHLPGELRCDANA